MDLNPQTLRKRPTLTRQLEIIHLTDVHFGSGHRFNPPVGPDGGYGAAKGMPTLAEKLIDDMAVTLPGREMYFATVGSQLVSWLRPDVYEPPPPAYRLLCITGDLATRADYREFEQAKQLILKLAGSVERLPGLKAVFVVPGNHDVLFDRQDVGERWSTWNGFYNSLYCTQIPADDPWAYAQVHDRLDELGAIVLCVNSSIYVVKGSSDEQRGQLEAAQLDSIRRQLEVLRGSTAESHRRFKSAVRIALIHHHPVLIPSLVEPNRNYDAVLQSGLLLNILHEYGFHLLLHGHKHHPHTFPEEIRNGFDTADDQPMLIVAGGSAGSVELPPSQRATNTYNRITVKWNPDAGQTRIRVVTRGLKMYDVNGRPLLPPNWTWETIKEDDRSFFPTRWIPDPTPKIRVGPAGPDNPIANEAARRTEYARTRGNIAVVEVRPSLVAGQAYEAIFWIVGHPSESMLRDVPDEVTWSAGQYFPRVTIRKVDDERFCACYDYWGSVLIQAAMKFSDKHTEYAHVYARIPTEVP